MGAAEARSHQQPACRSGRLPDDFWKGTNTATALSPRTPIILKLNTRPEEESLFCFHLYGSSRNQIAQRQGFIWIPLMLRNNYLSIYADPCFSLFTFRACYFCHDLRKIIMSPYRFRFGYHSYDFWDFIRRVFPQFLRNGHLICILI